MIHSLAAAILLISAVPTAAQDAEQRIEWNRPAEPFRLLDNVYYVGTDGLSAFLVTGPQGHVLIDGGLPESAPRIAANIRRLGFAPSDVRYLLINHAHFDHSGGLAELKRLTGAKLVASAGDRADLETGRTLNRPELAGFPKVSLYAKSTLIVMGPGPMCLRASTANGCTKSMSVYISAPESMAASITWASDELTSPAPIEARSGFSLGSIRWYTRFTHW